MDGYITTKEASGLLGIAQSSVARLIYNKKLQATKFANVWMVNEESVREYLERNKGKDPHDPTRGIID